MPSLKERAGKNRLFFTEANNYSDHKVTDFQLIRMAYKLAKVQDQNYYLDKYKPGNRLAQALVFPFWKIGSKIRTEPAIKAAIEKLQNSSDSPFERVEQLFKVNKELHKNRALLSDRKFSAFQSQIQAECTKLETALQTYHFEDREDYASERLAISSILKEQEQQADTDELDTSNSWSKMKKLGSAREKLAGRYYTKLALDKENPGKLTKEKALNWPRAETASSRRLEQLAPKVAKQLTERGLPKYYHAKSPEGLAKAIEAGYLEPTRGTLTQGTALWFSTSPEVEGYNAKHPDCSCGLAFDENLDLSPVTKRPLGKDLYDFGYLAGAANPQEPETEMRTGVGLEERVLINLETHVDSKAKLTHLFFKDASVFAQFFNALEKAETKAKIAELKDTGAIVVGIDQIQALHEASQSGLNYPKHYPIAPHS